MTSGTVGAPGRGGTSGRGGASGSGGTSGTGGSHTRRRLGRVVLAGAALVGLFLMLLRFIPALQLMPFLAEAASFVPFGILAWLVVIVVALRGPVRRRRQLVVALAVAALVIQLSWVLPYYIRNAPQSPNGTTSTGTTPTGTLVKVASINILGGKSDIARVSEDTADRDVVILIELDPETEAYVETLGWADRYPFRVGRSDPDRAPGLKIYSRFPLTELEDLDLYLGGHVVEVKPPTGQPLVLLSAHAITPLLGARGWRADGNRIADAAARYRGRPLLVIGDFNATPDHLTVRTIRARAGLTSVSDDLGAGWLPTWPADTAIPPILPLDQAFVAGPVVPTEIRTLPAPTSDHRGLAVDVVVGASPGP